MRTVGIDGGTVPPRRTRGQRSLLVAVFFDGLQIAGIRLGGLEVDGTDANEVLVSMLKGGHFDAVLLSGISFAGFNLVDIDRLALATRRPVIAVTGEKPDNLAVNKALRKYFDDWEDRWRMVRAAGTLHAIRPMVDEPKLYFEVKGGSASFAERIIKSTATISRLPEPVRVAGIVAKGLHSITFTDQSFF